MSSKSVILPFSLAHPPPENQFESPYGKLESLLSNVYPGQSVLQQKAATLSMEPAPTHPVIQGSQKISFPISSQQLLLLLRSQQ